MQVDSEDKDDGDNVLELEDASTTIEEAPIHVATTSTDEASCQKFLDFPSTKVALERTGVTSTHAEQMLLLGKMGARTLMEEPEHKNDYYTHERKHHGMLMKFTCKVKGAYENKV